MTLWGESAGAYSVCAHLAAPVSRRLFDRAIVQSGPCGDDLLSRVEADQRGELAATDLGCGDAADVAECLRQVPVEAIAGYLTGEIGFRRTSAELLWWPVAGTVLLPKQPLHAMRAGLANPVPVLLGGTRDEMRSYVIEHHDGIGEPLSPEAFPDVVAGLYGDEAPAVLDEYRLDQFESPGIALATILTDEGRFQGACQRLPYLDAASRRQPTFAYEFAELTGETPGGFPQGAAHGADVPYFFDSYQQPGEPLPPERQQLADELIARWTHFARTGEPGGGWPGYRDGVARSFAVDAIEPVDLAITHRCGFWGASPKTGGPT